VHLGRQPTAIGRGSAVRWSAYSALANSPRAATLDRQDGRGRLMPPPTAAAGMPRESQSSLFEPGRVVSPHSPHAFCSVAIRSWGHRHHQWKTTMRSPVGPMANAIASFIHRPIKSPCQPPYRRFRDQNGFSTWSRDTPRRDGCLRRHSPQWPRLVNMSPSFQTDAINTEAQNQPPVTTRNHCQQAMPNDAYNAKHPRYRRITAPPTPKAP
jgi:hypothetical protein